MSSEKNCTEKQPQMVLHPSSLSHKPNCTALLAPPHPAHPRGLSHSSGSLRYTLSERPLLLRHFPCVYRFKMALPVPSQHQHHTLLALISGPLYLLDLNAYCTSAVSYYSSYLPFFLLAVHWKVSTSFSCYLLGVNHGRQSFISKVVCEDFFFFPLRMCFPFMFSDLCHSAWASAILQHAKICLLQPEQPVHCCSCKGLQIYIFASDQQYDWYAILMTFQLHGALSQHRLRIMWHWPTVLLNSVTYIYSTHGFLVRSLLMFF